MQQKPLGPSPYALHPTLEVAYSWGRHAFQSQTQTPESFCLRAFSVHGAEWADWKCRIHVHTNPPLKHGGQELALGEIIMMMFYLLGSTQREWAPVGHSNNVLRCPLLDILPPHTPWDHLPNLSLGACLWGNPNNKTSISVSNKVSMAFRSTANHNLTLLFYLDQFVTRMICTVGTILPTVGDSSKALALPEDGQRSKCWGHLVLNPASVYLSSAGYLASMVISSPHVKWGGWLLPQGRIVRIK